MWDTLPYFIYHFSLVLRENCLKTTNSPYAVFWILVAIDVASKSFPVHPAHCANEVKPNNASVTVINYFRGKEYDISVFCKSAEFKQPTSLTYKLNWVTVLGGVRAKPLSKPTTASLLGNVTKITRITAAKTQWLSAMFSFCARKSRDCLMHGTRSLREISHSPREGTTCVILTLEGKLISKIVSIFCWNQSFRQ